MKKIIPFVAVIILIAACKKSSVPLTGNTASLATNTEDAVTFTSVNIGTQKWMTKNLSVTRYRNGDHIPQVKDDSKWGNLTTGAWCWYNNDSATGAVYGRLYNWYAVNDPRGLAPTGWHVASDAEWDTLSTFLGGYGVAGGKLKSTGTVEAGTGLWYAPNTGATNSSGFTGLPGGWRYNSGRPFYNIGNYGAWWSSTENLNYNAWSRNLEYDAGYMNRHYGHKRYGYSVRCLRD